MTLELVGDSCKVVCGDQHPKDRCVFITGFPSDVTQLTSAYYCLPADYMGSVFEYTPNNPTTTQAVALPAGSIRSIKAMTTHMVTKFTTSPREALIILTVDSGTDLLTLITPSGGRFTIMQGKSRHKLAPVVHAIDDFSTIENMWVFPAYDEKEMADIIVKGTRWTPADPQTPVCIQKQISSVFDAAQRFITNIQTTVCGDGVDLLMDKRHVMICPDDACL